MIGQIGVIYPHLKCISTVGNEQAENKRVHSRRPDVLDEHSYQTAEKFLEEALARFGKYDRKGPEIFIGEWATHETSFPPWDKRSRNEPPLPI
jgi:alpha-N-arabinofuranosidase